jgi:hypothetical protein
MTTCPHCTHLIAQTATERAIIERNVEAELCPCVLAACGHRLCEEMNDMPPCDDEGLCEQCCHCCCPICQSALQAMEECCACQAKSQTLREVATQHGWPIEEITLQAGQ